MKCVAYFIGVFVENERSGFNRGYLSNYTWKSAKKELTEESRPGHRISLL
jgi:hypothetical protein